MDLLLRWGILTGLHLAHRKIIEKTIFKAEERGLKSAVFLLDPHPVKVLHPHKDIFLLSSLQERAEILEEMGIDFIIIQKFTAEMAMLSPFKFIEEYLVNALKVKEIVSWF
jgi:riboflavin kinase / FMN adenylyltransferase